MHDESKKELLDEYIKEELLESDMLSKLFSEVRKIANNADILDDFYLSSDDITILLVDAIQEFSDD